MGGCTAWSVTDAITVTLPPASAPTLTVPSSSSTGSYTVSWTSVSTATSYALDEQVGSGSWTQIQSAASTSKALSGKADGSYSYRVRACNAAGCSGYAATKTITVLTPPTAAATITTPADAYSGYYTVSWTTVAKATSYTLQRSIDGGGWVTVQSGAGTSWNTTNQSPSSYSYRVQACNSAGCAGWSATKTTVVHGPPAMPASLTGYKEVQPYSRPPMADYYIDWSATSNTTYYELKESDAGQTGTTIYSGPGTGYIFTGSSYSKPFWVRACNPAGCSAWKGPLDL